MMEPTRFLPMVMLTIGSAVPGLPPLLGWSRTCTEKLVHGKWMLRDCKIFANLVCPPELLKAGLTMCASKCTFTETEMLMNAKELVSFESQEEKCYAECFRRKECVAVLYLTNNWCYLFGTGSINYGPVGPGTYYILERDPMEPNCSESVPVSML